MNSTTLAIILANRAGTLSINERFSERLGNTYFTLDDDKGTIEIALTEQEAEDRVSECMSLAKHYAQVA